MSVTYLGSKTVGQANIAIALALPALASTLTDLASRLLGKQGQVTANLAFIAAPPNPTDVAAALTGALAGFGASIAAIVASIPGPLVAANLSLATEIASLLALQTAINTAISTLTAAASAGGVHAFKIDSTPATVSGELAALVSGGIGGGLASARIQGVIFVTESPATFSAMSGVFLTG